MRSKSKFETFSIYIERLGDADVNGTRNADGRIIESRIGPNEDFGLTPGVLSTLSKPNSYPKSKTTPARRFVSKPNL